MSKVKKQHYMPQFYLKGFANARGRLFGMHRNNDGTVGRIFESSPHDVCAENYFYEVQRCAASDDGGHVEEGAIERMLSHVESEIAPQYQELLNSLSTGDLFNNENYISLANHLGVFIAMLIVRNPKWMEPRRGQADSLAKELLAGGFLSASDCEQLKQLGYEGEFQSLVELSILHAELFMTIEGSSLDHLFNLMEKMELNVLKACEEAEFIASSFPVRLGWDPEASSNPNTIYFPLSSQYAVVYRIPSKDNDRNCHNHLISVDARTVRTFNRCLMNGNVSDNYIFSSSKETLEDLAGGIS